MARRQAAVRLRFDDDLRKSLNRINRPRRSLMPQMGFLVCVCLVAAVLWKGTDFLHMPQFGGKSAAVVRTCQALTEALRTEKSDALSAFCAEGAKGEMLLQADNMRLMEGSAVHAAAKGDEEPAKLTCYAFLDTARRQLADQGIALDQIKPLAFGGVQAKVLDPGTMRDPALSLTGELYFEAGEKIYAIEFTARHCKADFVITNFWRCQPVEVPMEDLKKFSKERYALAAENEDAPGVTVKSPRYLFVAMPTKA